MPRKNLKPVKSPEDNDEFVTSAADLTVIKHVLDCRKESEDARSGRLKKNKINRDMYMGEQDFSYKQPGQSTEFLPKIPIAVENMSAFIRRGLTQFGDWFSADLGQNVPPIITPDQIRELLKLYMTKVYCNESVVDISTVISDGVKSGCLESLMIFKVHGYISLERYFSIEPGEPIINPDRTVTYTEHLVANEKATWRPRVDLIKQEDYFPDPSGQGLYEIHEVERDYSKVVEMAEAGIYDLAVVKKIDEDYRERREETRTAKDVGHSESTPPDFRKKILISEYWGHLLDGEGNIAHRNIVCAIANKKYLIRKPEPNPFWHGESPFVVAPIIRVPHSVWHKALYDHASQLNIALNELFNLMLDGGLAQVWGIKQLRMSDLVDPTQVSGGIPQGTTLIVKDTLPPGSKVMEQVTEGEVPVDAKVIYEAVQAEFAQAALSNELKMGGLPQRNVKATEIIEQSQSQAVTLDGIVGDIERVSITRLIRKFWLNLLQNVEDLERSEVVAAIGPAAAMMLLRMTPEQRYVAFNPCNFRVFGLSETLNKAKEFQKLMALMQVVSTNPLMLQAFFTRYSPDKALALAMKALNINPLNLERDEVEQARMGQDMQRLPMFMQIASGQFNENTGSAAPSASTVGESGFPGEINQMVNPMTGMSPRS